MINKRAEEILQLFFTLGFYNFDRINIKRCKTDKPKQNSYVLPRPMAYTGTPRGEGCS